MNIITKPYLSRKIGATVVDYAIFFTIFFFYVKAFGEPNDEGGYSVFGIKAIVIPLCWVLYFPVAEGFFNATLGHWIFGLMVVDEGGIDVHFGHTIKRRIADIVDLFFFGIPAIISIGKSEKSQRLGDLWAETLVVDRREHKKMITSG